MSVSHCNSFLTWACSLWVDSSTLVVCLTAYPSQGPCDCQHSFLAISFHTCYFQGLRYIFQSFNLCFMGCSSSWRVTALDHIKREGGHRGYPQISHSQMAQPQLRVLLTQKQAGNLSSQTHPWICPIPVQLSICCVM